MMKIDIFDVGHGGCSIITCPNGARVMVDCGLRLDPCWFPSITYFGEQFDLVVFGNLDEDHVEDLPHLWRNVRIRAIFSNPTVTAAALATMKRQHGMAEGVRHAHAILTEYGGGLIGQPPDLGNVEVCAYYNRFGVDFTDTNNLSLAFFVRYGAFTILFAGDLEKAGWRALLRLPAFARELASVNVFVASHHGRDNGCCAEIFQMCRPNVFVISDDEHQYESQDTTDWYRERAHGIPDFRVQPHPIIGYPHRYVLTTRRDGTLSMGATLDGSFLITPENPPLCGSGFRPALERRRALPIDSW